MKYFFYLSFRLFFRIKGWLTTRFTPAGLLILGGLVASAVAGLDTNQTMAYQAFTFLLFLILMSLSWRIIFRPRFLTRRKLPPFGTAGEPLPYRIVVINGTGRKQAGLTLWENLERVLPDFAEFRTAREPEEPARNAFDRMVGYHRWLRLLYKKRPARVRAESLPFLPPHGRAEIHSEIQPLCRGKIRLDEVSIACPDPFGLFRSFVKVSAPQSVLVLPKRYPLPPLELPGSRRYQPGGIALASSVGDSEEFLSLRDYRPGDPMRRIHWKSWAKTGKPIVKEYQDEFFVRHGLILDTFQDSEQSDVFEEAVSIAASFVFTVQTQESLLDLMFVGTEAYCFTSGRGIDHVDRMLEILASVRACTNKPFKTLFPLIVERSSLLSGCICVLLSWDEERQRLIRLLKALGVPLLVLVIMESDTSEPLDPGPMKMDPQNLLRLQVGKIEGGLARL
jgi:uncharacterized protein (DUF58 family)